ncbi:MAG: glutamate--cysteine ligase [Actinomycetia bacterium]|nr:glutamate--cysteine ligase [Actinomycetes bacterium]
MRRRIRPLWRPATPELGWPVVSSRGPKRGAHRAASSRIDFAGSPRPTVGVEWEFALVDAQTRDLSNEAASVIAELGETPHVHKELLRNTVEIVTGICGNAGEAMDDLQSTLRPVREIVRDRGMELFCAGTHPFAKWSAQKFTDAPRYSELIKRTQWWGRQMLIWGVHVHVGVSSAHKVMPIVTSLLNQYPHLLALSASSPYWDGEDTGYASNRSMMFQQLPTAGLPFHFQEWREFEGFVSDQKKTGIIDHMNEIRWDVRPSPHLGTVEVRIFDGVSNLHELSALVALTHCLIVDLDRRLDAGETLPVMPPWHVQENKWRAARYGVDAIIILDADSNERLVTEDLDNLVDRLLPVAESLSCVNELTRVADIYREGASYQRQRRVAEEHDGDLRTVVDALVGELVI